MPIRFPRRFAADSEGMALIVKVLSCGAVLVAGIYFAFLYWITRP
jgi:hypothetical protein